MSSSSSTRCEDREDSSQSSHRSSQRLFSMGELFRILLVVMQDIHATEPSDRPDPCLLCLRWVLRCRGHMHCHIHYHRSLSAPSSVDAEEAQLWENVSPDSSFLSAHLPAVIPSSPSEAASFEPNDETTLYHDRSVQVPAICPTCNQPILHSSQEQAYHDGDLDFSGGLGQGAFIDVPPLSQDTNSISLGATPSELDDTSFTSFDSVSDSGPVTPEGTTTPLSNGSHAVETPHTQPAVMTAAQAAVCPGSVSAPSEGTTTPLSDGPHAVDTPHTQSAAITAAQGANRLGPLYDAIVMEPSASENWYIVTRGRRVGVFDNSTAMTHAMSKVSGAAGRGGFSTRESAIDAFRSAEALGFVVKVPDV